MDELLPKVLGLVAFLGFSAIVAIAIIALFRPKVLPVVAEMFESIVLTLINAARPSEKRKRKPKEPATEDEARGQEETH